MKRINFIFILIIISVTLISCNSKNRFRVDTSKNRIEVKIHRFDKDLINLDVNHLQQSVDTLYSRYPDFLPVYTYNVLEMDAQNKDSVAYLFSKFVSDTTFQSVNKKVLTTFNDVSDIEKDISDAYTGIHHYFPELSLPQVYFFVSGFNRSVLMTNNFIGVGTDFYLGADYEPYKSFTYQYLLYNMRRESMAIDVVSAALFRHFSFDGTENGLVDNMLHRGKIIYLLSVFMPEKDIADLIGYSPEQWQWAEKYETDIWKTIVGQKHLFSTDMQLIRKYMNDAPFTAPVSQDSPGRLGTWVGWRIIDSYMQSNKDVSLEQLMKNNNYRQLLENSHYRP